MNVLRLIAVVGLSCAFAAPLLAAAADDLAKEVIKREAEVAKAKQTYDGAVKAADDKALKAYVRIAQRATKDNDKDGASLVWTEVLRLDREHAEARQWFTKLGTLDAVLTELDNPTDLFGNPVAGAVTKPGKAVLVFGPGGALLPSGVRTLTEAFTARTTELVVGNVVGDGPLFEEGGSVNGQALGVIGTQITYVLRAGGTEFILTAPFDRKAAWTHVAAQFDAGVVRLWLNGKAVASGTAPFAAIPAHGGGGLGRGDGGNCAGWTGSCEFVLASLRIANKARYNDQVKPTGAMEADADTVLGVTPEAIAVELAAQAVGGKKPREPIMLQRVDRMPPGNISWTASGTVAVR